MNTLQSLVLITALSTPFLLPIQAQEDGLPNSNDPRHPTQPQPPASPAPAANPERQNPDFRMGALKEASELIGSRVKNSSGQILGDIHELAVNLPQGEITTVIIATGGILGVGKRLVALPPQSLSLDVEGEVNADVDIERWSNAPDFDPEEWSIATHPDRVAANARYFTVQPRTPYRSRASNLPTNEPGTSPQPSPSIPTADATEALRASELIGKTVLGETGETIGDVEDLILDLSWGKVAQVIVASGGFLGIGEELSAIPPALFVQNSDSHHLQLKANKTLLSSAPRFKIGQWKDHSSPESINQVYSAYGLQPYFDPAPDSDGSRLQVREPLDPSQSDSILTGSEADARLTENIRKSIDRELTLSKTAREVEVASFNGRITLRGVVASETEKQTVEKIARQIAGGDQVDSQLTINKNIQ